MIAEGTPEKIAATAESYTGEFLKPILAGRDVPVGPPQPELVAAAPMTKAAAKRAAAAADAEKTAAKRAPSATATPRKAPAKTVGPQDREPGAEPEGELTA